MCDKSWRRRSSGTTLVEAVAGTVILGMLLVSILLARVQMDNQSRRAQDRLEACRILDILMEQWQADPSKAVADSQGTVPDHENWQWQTHTLQRKDADDIHADAMSVEVFAAGKSDAAATIEVLVPRENTNATDATTQKSPDAN